eukprot:TRINITY_DN2538_c2_g1_i2.p1 TRINITY_DN2538_c2_g1~~TRINITY_DN2538_c2_g1_i2.p1  ORF type:complete len:2760 (-),score=753.14 TRINITY_DN2538_c2_g1_i2:11-8005(-)
MWLARELLPAIIHLVGYVDTVNRGLPPISAAKLHYLQKRNEFVEGPSRITETQHPYSASHIKQVVNIPGAVFLALVFDESCTTAPTDHLQLYRDTTCQDPVGDVYSGTNWPRRRILVPGDTIVFCFSTDKSVKGNLWGYRCIVVGHMPNSNQESIPWSAHLEKTLCCLGGQFSSVLISGNELTEIEIQAPAVFRSELLSRGPPEEICDQILGTVWENRDVLVPRWKELGIVPEQSLEDKTVDGFLQGLLHNVPGSDGVHLYEWIEKNIIHTIGSHLLPIKEAQTAVLAVLLKHTGLVTEAISLTTPFESENRKNFLDVLPSNRLISVWQRILKVKQAIIQQHQEKQFHTSIEEDINVFTKRILHDSSGSPSDKREKSYRSIADKIISKANFLYNMMPMSQSTDSDTIASLVINFVLHPLPLDSIKSTLGTRRSRAFSRTLGLKSMQKLLRKANYPSMKHEILCFLGPALRNSALSKPRWPYHYLDHLEGAGIGLNMAVTNSFVSLMTDIAGMLQDDNCDCSLRLLALDPWVINFNLKDHAFLHSIQIFHILDNLTKIQVHSHHHPNHTTEDPPYEKKCREKVRKVSGNLFRLLGAICLGEEHTPGGTQTCDTLQSSFFFLLAQQLESVISAQTHFPDFNLKLTSVSSKATSSMVNLTSTKAEKAAVKASDFDWMETLCFLFSLSASSTVQTALSSSNFLRIFLRLLQSVDNKIQLLALRLFKKILPGQNPDQLMAQKGKNLITFLFEVIGSIHCLSAEISQLDHNFPLLQSFAKTLRGGMVTLKRESLTKAAKLDLSHPFFPFNDPEYALPTGWDKRSKGHVTLSEDTRTASFHSTTDDDEFVGLVRGNIPIPDGIRLFYYEILVVSEGEDGHVGIGLYPVDQKLRGMPGWYNGSYGYHGDDGCKFSYRLEGKGEAYGPCFVKDDVIGCGWNSKEGTVFYTKNGRYLGTAFRNVYGRFYPAVGVNSRGAQINVNFGQSQFTFDLGKLPSAHEPVERNGRVGHSALSLVSECVMLVRHLLSFSTWRTQIQKLITASIAYIPFLMKQLGSKTASPIVGNILTQSVSLHASGGDYSSLCCLVASLCIMGGHCTGLRVGGRVEVDDEGGGDKRRGVIIEYTPKSSTAIVVIDEEGTTQVCNVALLKPIPEVPVDPSMFSFPPSVLSQLAMFFSHPEEQNPFTLSVYHLLKSQVLKVVNLGFQDPGVIAYLSENELFSAIVDLGLETIDEEQPKISTMEKRSLLLKEHLFEVMAGSLSNDKAERRHSSADLKLPQYLLSPKISPYKRDEEDMSMKRKKSESFLSMSHRKKPSVTEVTIPNEVEEEEEDDIVEEEEEGVTGQKPRWSDIKPGVYLMVGKRENINNGRSDWVSEMDKTIGLVGLVKAKDSETKQVLLSFYEGDTASSYEWWYAKRVLIVPEKVTKDPFQQLSAGSQDDLVALANKTNKALSVLYARQAISYLMGSLPTNVLSVSMLGGPQKLTNMVKLVITEWAAAKDKNNSIIRRADPVKRHLSKLTALLKQEAVSNILPRDRRIERKSKNEILVPQKAGYLTKQGQLLKAWKRQWFVLQGNYLSYFKSPGSLDPLGVIDIQDTIVAEPIYLPKSKLRDFCFRLVTSRRIFILKASTPKDKLEWINLIESARLLSPVRNSMSPMTSRPSDQSLAWLLTRQAVKQLNNTVDMDVPYIMETSPQPFPAKIKIKKMIKFEGAERLIVVFDRNSKIGKYDMLRFFKDVGMRESIASFSYRGPNSFPPTIVESDRFWLSFTSEAANKGYKFYVMPLSIKQTDDVLLNKPSFDFGLSLVEWLLSLVPVWAKSFYCTEVYNALVGHVTEPYRPQKLDVRMKVFANLTKLLRRYREFPPESQLDLSRIRNLKVEMLELYHEEREGGEILLSSYLQRLVELQMQLEIVELTQRDDAVRNKSEVHHDEIQVENFKKSTPVKREEQRSKRTSKEEKKILKELESKKKKDDKKEVSKSNVDGSWFEESLSTFKLMIQLVRGENFPAIFVRQSCYSVLKKAVTEESPHPYPPGVRVTSTVHIPDAESLMVTFDPRCHTEPNVDTLMFSKLYVGGDELGVFSGEFKQQSPFIIPGNRFIWSFISESTSPGLWGFRFTVTPIFPEELQQEMEESCERDYRQMLSIFEDWTLASDHELVRFVQSSCEKLRISFREFSFDRFDSSDIQCYPMICDFPIQAIECRLRILKSFNTSVSMLLPLIDMRNISEEWSMAFLISTLRGLLFYDIKVGYISDILSRDATNLRRPLVSLNRQEEALKEECLFLQGFSELSKIDTVRLHQNERAFEVKLEKEGAEDVGGPYLECISQFCQDIQSKELGLFIMCPNGKEEIGFNQDKFVPSPQSTSAIRLEQFEFVGKILGIAIRTKNVLDLSLPSVLWKPLVGMRIDRSDLEAIDKCCCQFLDSIRNISKEGVTEENFNDIIFETMTTQSADGRVVELKPGGTNVAVTWQNRMEFVSLVEQYRMNEFNLQIDAIARGLSSVVPIHLLSLFSWQELEFRVCGRPGIDLDMLEKHTEYCSVNSTDRHVQDFWQVMRSFTAEEQALFLRFVSGRSRLPPENEFTTPFKLHAFTKASDGYEDGFLPEAQTCFFSLALPSYSSQQIMKERLLYAINTCKEIDTDFVVPDHNFIPSEEDVSEVDDASDSESETIEDSNCANQ